MRHLDVLLPDGDKDINVLHRPSKYRRRFTEYIMYKLHDSLVSLASMLHGQEPLIICLQQGNISHSQILRLEMHVSA